MNAHGVDIIVCNRVCYSKNIDQHAPFSREKSLQLLTDSVRSEEMPTDRASKSRTTNELKVSFTDRNH